MGLFRNKKVEKAQISFKGEPIIKNYSVDKFWYAKTLFVEHFNHSGNWGCIYEEGWDGITNNIELLDFMERQGWVFITAVYSGEDNVVEYIFNKKKIVG